MSISIRHVTKRFGNKTVLHDISLDIPSGCLLSLLGPSGSGKTTLLRIIAGLEQADSGTVLYQDEDVTNQKPQSRNVGFVFQHYALFRHMTVFENIAFPLRIRRWPFAKIQPRVRELLDMVRLENLERRYPSQLSGGQRQRVALARALAFTPRVLLLDEPFGALDARVRQQLRESLRETHDKVNTTTVFVTHDQEEAFEVSDQVVVMNEGRIEQQGRPQHVFDHPANPFVMDFVGNANVFHGHVQNGKAMMGSVELAYPDYQNSEVRAATGYIRPHELDIDRIPMGEGSLRARILQINPAGSFAKVRVLIDDYNWYWNVNVPLDRYQSLNLRSEETVWVFPRQVRLFLPADDFTI